MVAPVSRRFWLDFCVQNSLKYCTTLSKIAAEVTWIWSNKICIAKASGTQPVEHKEERTRSHCKVKKAWYYFHRLSSKFPPRKTIGWWLTIEALIWICWQIFSVKRPSKWLGCVPERDSFLDWSKFIYLEWTALSLVWIFSLYHSRGVNLLS